MRNGKQIGFVGNYLRHCGAAFGGFSLHDLPELLPKSFSPPGARLSKLEQVRACDVITLGNCHVQIIDRVEELRRDDAGEVSSAASSIPRECSARRSS